MSISIHQLVVGWALPIIYISGVFVPSYLVAKLGTFGANS
jgi:hypothetical protein